ncbi:NYN domain-containing protein [Pelagibius marinus]|uniref:NYN domain-containing protein n=1 Tax=Pelagibius marinus TaxID=2762760 RepID=UPI00187292BD|nr:NYN domain-containing protein [Pelagibius marinus]
MSDWRSPRLAVLIDADNSSSKIADGLFEEIAAIGEASVRRIYGDFSHSRSKGWKEVLPKYAIIPHQQFPYTVGKNASDVAMVIDAMDLLHSGRFDAFCLVSSDSDFTRLAARIREEGLDVYGFGEQKTPESFRQACHRFIYTENLLPEPVVDNSALVARKPLRPASAATPLIRRAMAQLGSEDGWAHLSPVGKQLGILAPDFDPRTYGCRKLSDLVRSTGAFQVEAAADGGRVRIRFKPSSKPTKKAATKKAKKK